MTQNDTTQKDTNFFLYYINFQKYYSKNFKKKFKEIFFNFLGKFLTETSNNNDIFENLSNKEKNFLCHFVLCHLCHLNDTCVILCHLE